MRELKLFYSAIKAGNLKLLEESIKNTNFEVSHFMEVRDNEVEILNFNFLPANKRISLQEQYLDKDIAGLCWIEYTSNKKVIFFCRYNYKYRKCGYDSIVRSKVDRLIYDYFGVENEHDENFQKIKAKVEERQKQSEALAIAECRNEMLGF